MSSRNLIRISAAGSGKSWQICNDALSAAYSGECSLITTYTNKGVESIKEEIRKQNDGMLHEKIIICSWYQFLLSEMIRPYQTVIAEINEISGFDFSQTYGYVNYGRTGNKSRYINAEGRVKSNFASELAMQIVQLSKGASLTRLERCYSKIFIDEVQDLAGYDINIVAALLRTQIRITCAGDNKQATYSTHNTRKNKAKSGVNVWDFFAEAQQNGLATIERNLESRRCNGDICNFANAVFPNANNISSIMSEESNHDGVFLISTDDAQDYIDEYKPQILRYDIKTDVGARQALNFGQCKGMTFDRVLVYPNKPLREFVAKEKELKSPYKYYVAVTRPRFSLAIVLDDISNCSNSFVDITIVINGKQCVAKKYNDKG